MTSDDFIDRTTAELPKRPVPPALRAARSDVLAAVDSLSTIRDQVLTRPWTWKGGSEEELRYGFYRIAEAFERAGLDAETAIRASGAASERSVELVRSATAARWDLQGILATLDAATWDAAPGGDEWTIRQTLGHLIGSQRGYEVGTSWWLSQRLPAGAESLPPFPEDLGADLPSDDEEAAGTPGEVRGKLDDALDRATERLAALRPEQLAYGGRWSGFPVDLAFRHARWASHIREHTIQVEKTMALLGTRQTEVARLIRLVLAAWGRAEATVFGRDEAAAAGAVDVLARAARDARSTADDVASLAAS